jgi:excisionase family DNA binding protein
MHLTIDQVAQRYNVSEVTIARWWRAGSIPAPVRLGRRAIRWRAADLDAFDAAQQPVQFQPEAEHELSR